MTRRSSQFTKKSAVALAMTFAAFGGALGGCLLTSDFDNIAGVRPADASPPIDEPDAAPTVDANDDVADAAPFSCATETPPHFICSDFDEGSLTKGGWFMSQTPPGTMSGSATLDKVQFVSPPAAFLGHLLQNSETSVSSAVLVQNLKIAPKGFHLAFDVRIGTCRPVTKTNGSVTLAIVRPSLAVTFGFIIATSGEFVFGQSVMGDAGSMFTPSTLTPPPKPNVWSRVVTDVTLAPTTSHVKVTVDNMVALEQPVAGVTLDPSPLTTINIGPDGTGPIGDCTIDYDNVTFDPDL